MVSHLICINLSTCKFKVKNELGQPTLICSLLVANLDRLLHKMVQQYKLAQMLYNLSPFVKFTVEIELGRS